MKVKCTQCGKRFDYDTYMGMCPNCFAYYKKSSAVDRMSEPDKQKDKLDTIQQGASDTVQRRKQKVIKTGHSRSYYAVTFLLSAVIILSAAVSFVLAARANKASYSVGSLTMLPDPVYISFGKAVAVPYAEDDFFFTIMEAAVVKDDRYQVPSGYQLVRVSYRVSAANSDDGTAGTEYLDYGSYGLRRGLHPYLMTRSGSYLPPLEKYDFKNIHILESEEADLLEISTYFKNIEGSFYFLVKENDAKGLRINCHSEKSNVWGNSVEPLEICYEIIDLEVD